MRGIAFRQQIRSALRPARFLPGRLSSHRQRDVVQPGVPADHHFSHDGNGPAANGKKLSINLDFTETKEKYALTLDNSVLNYSGNRQAKDADCTVTLTRGELNDIILGRSKLPQLITSGTVKIEGNEKALQELLGLLDSFDIWFDVITANPPPRAGE